mmetsp:Transcript_2989/g.8583  ORF Transcript_2989/g.8583 Transcript_2989/m.8583 type:complete len:275 (+) Transcript_2989:635-1459(+)
MCWPQVAWMVACTSQGSSLLPKVSSHWQAWLPIANSSKQLAGHLMEDSSRRGPRTALSSSGSTGAARAGSKTRVRLRSRVPYSEVAVNPRRGRRILVPSPPSCARCRRTTFEKRWTLWPSCPLQGDRLPEGKLSASSWHPGDTLRSSMWTSAHHQHHGRSRSTRAPGTPMSPSMCCISKPLPMEGTSSLPQTKTGTSSTPWGSISTRESSLDTRQMHMPSRECAGIPLGAMSSRIARTTAASSFGVWHPSELCIALRATRASSVTSLITHLEDS